MPAPRVLRTERLELRAWQPGDEAAHRAVARSAGDGVHRPGPAPLTAAPVDRSFEEKLAAWAEQGRGSYAVREHGRPEALLAEVGLAPATLLPELVPALVLGWRSTPEGRGRGLEAEAARAVAGAAFDHLGVDRLLVLVEEEDLAVADVAGALGDGASPPEAVRVEGRDGAVLARWLRPRHLARAEVLRFVAVDPQQAAAQERILGLLDDPALVEADLLGRDDAGHLTGSAVVLDASGERALLLWHKKVGAWLQPGGHLDGDFDLARSALREATEETGIEGLRLLGGGPVDLDVHRVGFGSGGPHDHHDVRYVVVAPPGAEPVANAEADRFRWVTADEVRAAADVDPGTTRLVLHALGRAQALA